MNSVSIAFNGAKCIARTWRAVRLALSSRCECQPCVVVNRYERRLPASAPNTISSVGGDAMARQHNAAELLGVDVKQIAGRLVLVVHDGLGKLQVT